MTKIGQKEIWTLRKNDFDFVFIYIFNRHIPTQEMTKSMKVKVEDQDDNRRASSSSSLTHSSLQHRGGEWGGEVLLVPGCTCEDAEVLEKEAGWGGQTVEQQESLRVTESRWLHTMQLHTCFVPLKKWVKTQLQDVCVSALVPQELLITLCLPGPELILSYLSYSSNVTP